jgi:F-type H+-transporting ATPase subunit a
MSRIGLRVAKIVAVIAIVLGIIILGNKFVPFKLPPIEFQAEPIPGLTIPLIGSVTNSLLGAITTSLLLIIGAFLGTRKGELIPRGFQNFVEAVIETMYKLVESIAGEERARSFFPLTATIFLFVLVSNWMDLLTPLLVYIGPTVTRHGETVAVPLLRSPSTDLNFTIALALISVITVQIYGVRVLGLSYFGKFINLGSIVRAFRPGPRVQRRGCMVVVLALFMGAIDFFVGLLELLSELTRIISFSFRLFGNIFAGEVILLVIPSLASMLLVLPFLGLEVFVGFIQALIFSVLTLAFLTMATTPHGGGEHH